VRRSAAWTVAGGVLLWTASMLTYAAGLLVGQTLLVQVMFATRW
jgi:hypothetical protein